MLNILIMTLWMTNLHWSGQNSVIRVEDMLHIISIIRDTNDILQLTSKFLKKRLEQNICKDNFKPVPQRSHLKK